MLRHRLAWAALVVTLALLVGIRIWHVNQSQLHIPVEHYNVGEEVDLDGAFLDDAKENTKGYYLTVSKAEVMDSDEYLARYAPHADPSTIKNGSGDVLVLTYDVRNVGNDSGYLDMVSQMVIADDRTTFYTMDYDLWGASEPQLNGSTLALVLKPNSSYTTHMPFSYIDIPKPFEKMLEDKNYCRRPIPGKAFELLVTNAPTNKVIDIQL
ncbi:DUF5028 domain-containing protein [Olsenella massiliensis]|uniref:DUF5028 domain-containing protein n=1 Tax=Olsenella massiliensis TaxID=1622075 RepID=UPI00071D617F|nr:DUF5028 domain-containing protein [Olsenella massiliensis]